MDAEAGPAHGPPAKPVITESNDDADAAKPAARPPQAAAAIYSGPDPAPAKIRAELISGGNHAKSRIIATPTQPAASAAPTQSREVRHTRQPHGRIVRQITLKVCTFTETFRSLIGAVRTNLWTTRRLSSRRSRNAAAPPPLFAVRRCRR